MVAQVDSKYKSFSKERWISRIKSYALFEGRPLTTRGRYINRFLFALYSIIKRFGDKDTMSPVYIVGTGRSGTTILGVVLSMHRCIGFLNEPKALWASVVKNEDVIGSYNLNKSKYLMDESDVVQNYRPQLSALYNAYLKFSDNKVVVDKYPELVFRYSFVKKIFPKSKYLFLVRNGWDTVVSIDNWSKRKSTSSEEKTEDWWGLNDRKWLCLVNDVASKDDYFKDYCAELLSDDNHVHRAAVEWVLVMKAGYALLDLYGEDVLEVRYEQLVSKPGETLTSILDFIGQDDDETMQKYASEELKPIPPRQPVELPAFIKVEFDKVMRQLGYAD